MENFGTSYETRLADILEAHRPSRHPFFRALADAPRAALGPDALGELYLRYQAAMHATRVMVYHLPHLEAPSLRVRKLVIYIDDDGLPGGDTHHAQLARAFRNLGARLPLADDDFGDLDELVHRLDPETARFVSLVRDLYPRSLGPWCAVELLSDDFLGALAGALAVHFPAVRDEPYFADVFAQGIEHRHGQEALAITKLVLERRPHLLDATLADARTLCHGLDGLWSSLAGVIAPISA
jgi:hypothetical protein